MCSEHGKFTEATVCDHKVPHRGNEELFWKGPFQSLCFECHDRHKQRLEKGGKVMGCSADGMPFDKNHLWNKEREWERLKKKW